MWLLWEGVFDPPQSGHVPQVENRGSSSWLMIATPSHTCNQAERGSLLTESVPSPFPEHMGIVYFPVSIASLSCEL